MNRPVLVTEQRWFSLEAFQQGSPEVTDHVIRIMKEGIANQLETNNLDSVGSILIGVTLEQAAQEKS